MHPTYLVALYRNLNTAESVKASKSSKKSFSLKTFMTLKPSWPPKPAIKSQESHESMTSPHSTHSMILLPPLPDLPSEMRRLRNAPKAVHVFKIPTIRPGVKITYEEASREPMDIESYYAVDKVSSTYICSKLVLKLLLLTLIAVHPGQHRHRNRGARWAAAPRLSIGI